MEDEGFDEVDEDLDDPGSDLTDFVGLESSLPADADAGDVDPATPKPRRKRSNWKSKDPAPNTPRAKEARQREFLELVLNGYGVTDATRQLGMSFDTYARWRKENKIFAAKVDSLRRGDRTADLTGASKDFAAFRKQYFGFDSYFHHLEIVRALESSKPMSVTMVLCAPEHGKTTVVEDWICFKLATDPNFRITVVSEGQPHARKIIGRVQQRMTDFDLYSDYITTFGPFYVEGQERKGKPWTRDFMTVYRANGGERDYSLEARGAGSRIAGTRADILIFDDIQSRENLNQTEKLVAKIRQDFLTRPGRDGRTLFVGTRVDVADVYETLQDEGVVNKLISLPATDVAYDARGELNATEVPCSLGSECDVPEIPHEAALCPEMWDPHSLAFRRRQVGDAVWWRNYQQKPLLAGDATFTETMVDDAWDKLRRVGDWERDNALVVVSLDPALGGGNAVTAAALHPDRMEVIDAISTSGLGTIQGIVTQVGLFAKTYGASICIVETDTHQKGIARSSEMEALCRDTGMRVIEHRTSGEKADPVFGVAMMAGGFARKEIRLPGGDDYSRRRIAPLVAELRSWRHDIATKKLRQDQVMSLWFVWKYWMETRNRGDGSQFHRAGTPWKPTGWKRQGGYLHHQTRRGVTRP